MPPIFAARRICCSPAAAVAIAAAKVVGAENVLEPSRYTTADQGRLQYEPARPAASVAEGTARSHADVRFE